MMSLDELWTELATLSSHVAEDNIAARKTKEGYPFHVRRMQIKAIESLVLAIKEIHG